MLLPETIAIEQHELTAWFFTTAQGNLQRKGAWQLRADVILDAWGAGQADLHADPTDAAHPTAMLITPLKAPGPDEPAAAYGGVRVEYLSAMQLSHLLHHKLPAHGLLQRWTTPRTPQNSVIRAVLEGGSVKAWRRTARPRIRDTSVPMLARCACWDAAGHTVTTAGISSELVLTPIETLLRSIVQHVAAVTDRRVLLTRVDVLLKHDPVGRLWLLWPNSLAAQGPLPKQRAPFKPAMQEFASDAVWGSAEEYSSRQAAAVFQFAAQIRAAKKSRDRGRTDEVTIHRGEELALALQDASRPQERLPRAQHGMVGHIPNMCPSCLARMRDSPSDPDPPVVVYKTIIAHYEQLLQQLGLQPFGMSWAEQQAAALSIKDTAMNSPLPHQQWPDEEQAMLAAGLVGIVPVYCASLEEYDEVSAACRANPDYVPPRPVVRPVPPVISLVEPHLSPKEYRCRRKDPLWLFTNVQVCKTCAETYRDVAARMVTVTDSISDPRAVRGHVHSEKPVTQPQSRRIKAELAARAAVRTEKTAALTELRALLREAIVAAASFRRQNSRHSASMHSIIASRVQEHSPSASPMAKPAEAVTLPKPQSLQSFPSSAGLAQAAAPGSDVRLQTADDAGAASPSAPQASPASRCSSRASPMHSRAASRARSVSPTRAASRCSSPLAARQRGQLSRRPSALSLGSSVSPVATDIGDSDSSDSATVSLDTLKLKPKFIDLALQLLESAGLSLHKAAEGELFGGEHRTQAVTFTNSRLDARVGGAVPAAQHVAHPLHHMLEMNERLAYADARARREFDPNWPGDEKAHIRADSAAATRRAQMTQHLATQQLLENNKAHMDRYDAQQRAKEALDVGRIPDPADIALLQQPRPATAGIVLQGVSRAASALLSERAESAMAAAAAARSDGSEDDLLLAADGLLSPYIPRSSQRRRTTSRHHSASAAQWPTSAGSMAEAQQRCASAASTIKSFAAGELEAGFPACGSVCSSQSDGSEGGWEPPSGAARSLSPAQLSVSSMTRSRSGTLVSTAEERAAMGTAGTDSINDRTYRDFGSSISAQRQRIMTGPGHAAARAARVQAELDAADRRATVENMIVSAFEDGPGIQQRIGSLKQLLLADENRKERAKAKTLAVFKQENIAKVAAYAEAEKAERKAEALEMDEALYAWETEERLNAEAEARRAAEKAKRDAALRSTYAVDMPAQAAKYAAHERAEAALAQAQADIKRGRLTMRLMIGEGFSRPVGAGNADREKRRRARKTRQLDDILTDFSTEVGVAMTPEEEDIARATGCVKLCALQPLTGVFAAGFEVVYDGEHSSKIELVCIRRVVRGEYTPSPTQVELAEAALQALIEFGAGVGGETGDDPTVPLASEAAAEKHASQSGNGDAGEDNIIRVPIELVQQVEAAWGRGMFVMERINVQSGHVARSFLSRWDLQREAPHLPLLDTAWKHWQDCISLCAAGGVDLLAAEGCVRVVPPRSAGAPGHKVRERAILPPWPQRAGQHWDAVEGEELARLRKNIPSVFSHAPRAKALKRWQDLAMARLAAHARGGRPDDDALYEEVNIVQRFNFANRASAATIENLLGSQALLSELHEQAVGPTLTAAEAQRAKLLGKQTRSSGPKLDRKVTSAVDLWIGEGPVPGQPRVRYPWEPQPPMSLLAAHRGGGGPAMPDIAGAQGVQHCMPHDMSGVLAYGWFAVRGYFTEQVDAVTKVRQDQQATRRMARYNKSAAQAHSAIIRASGDDFVLVWLRASASAHLTCGFPFTLWLYSVVSGEVHTHRLTLTQLLQHPRVGHIPSIIGRARVWYAAQAVLAPDVAVPRAVPAFICAEAFAIFGLPVPEWAGEGWCKVGRATFLQEAADRAHKRAPAALTNQEDAIAARRAAGGLQGAVISEPEPVAVTAAAGVPPPVLPARNARATHQDEHYLPGVYQRGCLASLVVQAMRSDSSQRDEQYVYLTLRATPNSNPAFSIRGHMLGKRANINLELRRQDLRNPAVNPFVHPAALELARAFGLPAGAPVAVARFKRVQDRWFLLLLTAAPAVVGGDPALEPDPDEVLVNSFVATDPRVTRGTGAAPLPTTAAGLRPASTTLASMRASSPYKPHTPVPPGHSTLAHSITAMNTMKVQESSALNARSTDAAPPAVKQAIHVSRHSTAFGIKSGAQATSAAVALGKYSHQASKPGEAGMLSPSHKLHAVLHTGAASSAPNSRPASTGSRLAKTSRDTAVVYKPPPAIDTHYMRTAVAALARSHSEADVRLVRFRVLSAQVSQPIPWITQGYAAHSADAAGAGTGVDHRLTAADMLDGEALTLRATAAIMGEEEPEGLPNRAAEPSFIDVTGRDWSGRAELSWQEAAGPLAQPGCDAQLGLPLLDCEVASAALLRYTEASVARINPALESIPTAPPPMVTAMEVRRPVMGPAYYAMPGTVSNEKQMRAALARNAPILRSAALVRAEHNLRMRAAARTEPLWLPSDLRSVNWDVASDAACSSLPGLSAEPSMLLGDGDDWFGDE